MHIFDDYRSGRMAVDRRKMRSSNLSAGSEGDWAVGCNIPKLDGRSWNAASRRYMDDIFGAEGTGCVSRWAWRATCTNRSRTPIELLVFCFSTASSQSVADQRMSRLARASALRATPTILFTYYRARLLSSGDVRECSWFPSAVCSVCAVCRSVLRCGTQWFCADKRHGDPQTPHA